ncbi:hypothetical protein [Kingella sp. (in: b-proteobacteria)]|uniref:hypothetical protein n=1 Tax=Kingella sp. (in: b-proteobacteria) TaxID=2020713 RepID=UPI0026DA97A6|nr:hypothetical protein [Kingella sp. (in: b-proteobacteria)]MDO4657143.1 hypothetical protein [Kingella sp. (in: b-proteobacteria)]
MFEVLATSRRRSICGSLKNHLCFSGCLCDVQRQPEMFALRQRKEWVWRRYAMFCLLLCERLGQPERHRVGCFQAA